MEIVATNVVASVILRLLLIENTAKLVAGTKLVNTDKFFYAVCYPSMTLAANLWARISIQK